MVANPLHAIWSSVAPAWNQYADFVDERGAKVGAAMLAAADLQPGENVLELGCGPGGVGIAAAEVVGVDGHVVLSDVVPEMTAIAEARARQHGLGNVTVRQLDMEHIDAPDSSFDKVLGREALMLVGDPVGAAREAIRVLRPGGRAVFAVWSKPAANPWLSALLDAVSTQLGAPVPPPGVPGPFSLCEEGALAGILSTAGFADVAIDEVEAPLHAESFDDWWTVVPSLAGPLAALLNSLPDEATATIRADAQQALTRYADGSGYTIPGASLIGVGHHNET
ncbi:class I SAM-dependent methyltransferase [Mycobacterium sp. 1274761.0]|uniref:class I SAM-dependent methyltransferase n=1 Tax=Mycobacterium sp. 1274761.0 TaxID=1834077 RepID=UPI0007FC13B3|nr:class I SAM-dependent methyltransferase [Mycobacterium sp. 1274761.0]OBK74148.1 methyltransferase type 11 [Mycobacterium sp. 1274761.0]